MWRSWVMRLMCAHTSAAAIKEEGGRLEVSGISLSPFFSSYSPLLLAVVLSLRLFHFPLMFSLTFSPFSVPSFPSFPIFSLFTSAYLLPIFSPSTYRRISPVLLVLPCTHLLFSVSFLNFVVLRLDVLKFDVVKLDIPKLVVLKLDVLKLVVLRFNVLKFNVLKLDLFPNPTFPSHCLMFGRVSFPPSQRESSCPFSHSLLPVRRDQEACPILSPSPCSPSLHITDR